MWNCHTCPHFTPSDVQNQNPFSMDPSNPNPSLPVYLNFITLPVNSQRHIEAIHLDFSNAFYIFSYALLLRKIASCLCYLVPQLRDQQIIPSSPSWRTLDTVWFVIRCVTGISPGATSHCFHKWLLKCSRVFKLPSLCRRRQNISINKIPSWQLVTAITYK